MFDIKKYCNDTFVNPPYPPYHEGKDLEDYFIDYYYKHKQQFDDTSYTFIPVKWTAIYNHHRYLTKELQKDIANLDTQKKYFTVSQHDDAPEEKLPPNTINFSAGGNAIGTIPIPLICSPIKNLATQYKDIFCSFVGSVPPPIGGNCTLAYNLRMEMLNTLVNISDYTLKPRHWTLEVKKERQDLFLDITSRSKFTLCPRGYGATSFRLYEAMQLQSIPVYIFTKEPFLPFALDIDWTKLCILVDYKNIKDIDYILKAVTEEKYNEIIEYTKKIYEKYFTLEGMCVNILKHLQKNERYS